MSDARMAWTLAAGALLMRLVLGLGSVIFGTDSAQFLLMAEWMSAGEFQRALEVSYHPLYPLLVAAAGAVLGSVEAAGFWVSMVLGAAATAPLYLLARAVFGRPAAFVGALIYAFQPHTVELHGDVMTEGAFTFFFVGAAWLCWRNLESPSVERAVLAGLAAAGAFLTRPEGILAVVLVVAWPLAHLFRKGNRRVLALGAAVCVLTVLLAAFPYLLWVRSQWGDGKWHLSWKPTAIMTEKHVKGEGPEYAGKAPKVLKSVVRMTYVTAPFMAIGAIFGLRGLGWRGPLFFLSFPLGYLAGLFYALRAIPWFSYRYVVPSMNLLMVLAGVGVVVVIRFLARRWPERRWVPVSLALIALVSLPMSAPCFRVQRRDQAALREAGIWIRSRQAEAEVYSTEDKIGFFAGRKVRAYEPERGEFAEAVRKRPPDYCVFLEGDRAPGYLTGLAGIGGLREVRTFPDPPRPGVTKVHVYSSR